ncbi:pyrroloquinoline quinone precursor peptide PqqA [Paraburkholderia sp.]|uniref:pyrroloquinoline quinone precursor peptide PqqA n=1 Tax=Paraburkholderia sp. TaxID=1926495 RepID=UPI00345D48C7
MPLASKETAAHPVWFFHPIAIHLHTRRHAMQWPPPSYTDLRFGFEITMYVANR